MFTHVWVGEFEEIEAAHESEFSLCKNPSEYGNTEYVSKGFMDKDMYF